MTEVEPGPAESRSSGVPPGGGLGFLLPLGAGRRLYLPLLCTEEDDTGQTSLGQVTASFGSTCYCFWAPAGVSGDSGEIRAADRQCGPHLPLGQQRGVLQHVHDDDEKLIDPLPHFQATNLQEEEDAGI